MTSLRLFSALLLLGFACLLYGCGNSSNSTTKTNNPLEIAGTWSISATATQGTNSLSAVFSKSTCSSGATMGIYSVSMKGSDQYCFIAMPPGALSTTTPANGTPQGMIIAVSVDPVPANGTATINDGFFVELDGNGNSDAYDLSGTFTASTKTLSGSYTCDMNSTTCAGKSGTFTATVK